MRAIQARAADVKASLLANPAAARDVLTAFVPRSAFTPFGAGRVRGYRFSGTGDYGPLLGTTLGAGVPDGKCPP